MSWLQNIGGLIEQYAGGAAPPFAQLASQLFGNSGGVQQAGLLNTLLSSVGPAAVQRLAAEHGLPPQLTGMLGGGQVTAEAASQVPADFVQKLASHAESHDSSIIGAVGGFYAQHPTVVKTLGAAALAMAMSRLASRG